MLRSFDYAARHQLLTHPERASLTRVASDWVRRNGEAFCAGYAEAGGLDPACNAVLLRALLLDKDGRNVSGAPVKIDGPLIILTPGPLPPGVYKVSWHSVGHDTHRLDGNFNFTVKP